MRGHLSIFFDLDGVCADLYGALATHYKVPYYTSEHRAAGSGPIAAYEDWRMNKGLWGDADGPLVDANFWATLPVFPWAKQLVKEAKKFGDVHILSNPGREEFSFASAPGKIRWCLKNLGLSMHRIILAADKSVCAKDVDCVLIDDCEKNTKEWHDAGGTALLFPQPYNSNFPLTSVEPITWTRSLLSALL